MGTSGEMVFGLSPQPSVFLDAYPYLTQFWLTVSVAYDLFLGAVPFIVLVVLWPKLQTRASAVITVELPVRQDFDAVSSADWLSVMANKIARALKMRARTGPHQRPAHLQTWLLFNWLQVNAWAVIVGVFGDLALSVGWHNPLSWSGLWFDLLYARANGQPNGAHIVSYIGLPAFALAVAYKFGTQKGVGKIAGDAFQGAAAAGFIGGLHELLWMPLRFMAYGVEPVLSEQIRDASFAVMCLLLIGTFWKFPSRKIPLSTFKWPVVAYVGFLCFWFFVPHLFGYPYLPITTINDPRFGNNFYQQTPWYNVDWVQGAEVFGWVMLWVPFIVQVLRYHGRRD